MFYHFFCFLPVFFFKKELLRLSIFLWVFLTMTLFLDENANLHIILSRQNSPGPFLFCSGKQVIALSLSMPLPIPISFAPYLTSYDARTYTLNFCIFHTYGDILASLFTFIGTGIFCMLIVFNWNPDVKLSKKKQSKCLLTVYQL